MAESSVCVVLATFNGERFLREQLDSYLQQTVPPDQLVVGDDGSTDGTLALLESFRRRAPFPVTILRNETQLGYGANFLNAARSARTQLIAFSDQDDIWLPGKIERAKQAFEDERVVLATHAVTLIDAHGRTVGFHGQNIDIDAVVAPNLLNPWHNFPGFTMTITKELCALASRAFEARPIVPDPLFDAHDRWLYFMAVACGWTALIANPLAAYRQHGGNLFGHGEKVRSSSVRESLRQIVDRSEGYAQVARYRSDLLRDLASDTKVKGCEGVAAGYMRWNRIAESIDKRLNLYRQRRRTARFAAWVGNLSDGIYREPGNNATSYRSVFKDALTILK